MTTVADLLPAPLRLGAAQHSGSLAVFPLFGGEPRLEYQSFAQGQAAGVTVQELPDGASVNDLLVANASPLPVLLFEGQEVLGAQQNRVFDASVLVPAGTKVKVPVSCVEAGRWDGGRHGEQFAAAPQTAYPALRRAKNVAARTAAAAGREARADQGGVWDDVARKSERLHAASPTGAMHDIYVHHRARLDELCAAAPRQDHQIGAVVAIGGRCVVVDLVSRSDVWAALHAPLVRGYALDALEHSPAAPPPAATIDSFIAEVLDAPLRERDAVGAGIQLDVETASAAGTGLALEGELLQLSAFAPDRPAPRIRRPSQRR